MKLGYQAPKQTFFGWLWSVFEPKPAKSEITALPGGDYSGMENIQDVSGKGLATNDNAYEVDAERINAIQQYNSKGFVVYEINPRLLDPTNNSCAIPPDEFFETIGPDAPYTCQPGGYRSVILPITGNFLKLEFGPPKFRDNQSSSPGVFQLSGGLNFATPAAFDGPVFLNFGDISGKSFKIKSGDSFTLWYNTIILTFPANYAKLRIITGVNSTYESQQSTIPSLHLAGSDVVFDENNYLKPTPFSLLGDVAAVNIGSTSTTQIIALSPNTVAYGETNFGWINFVGGSFNAGASGSCRVSLVLRDSVFGTNLKTLFTLPIVFQSGLNSFSTVFHEAIRFYSGITPILINGLQNVGLYFVITAVAGGNTNGWTFSVGGYSLGPIYLANGTSLPGYFRYILNHSPWGIDTTIGATQT